MLLLQGRTIQKSVKPETGWSILDLAVNNGVDWGFSCTRGTCARCRCKIEAGMEFLSEPNEAEQARLGPEEIEQGYRLGCQTVIEQEGTVKARHETYF